MHLPLSVSDDSYSTAIQCLQGSGSNAVITETVYTDCSPNKVAVIDDRPCVIQRFAKSQCMSPLSTIWGIFSTTPYNLR